nr:ThiF family adenylyltransferase [Bacteroidota bacterium]
MPKEFLTILHHFEGDNTKNSKGNIIPLFIGYRTIETEIHWQVAMLEVGKFPLCGVPEIINDTKTGKWISELADEKIIWSLSRNSSYKYFFGRGTLSQKITDKKILVIGVGAIGSMVANTLTRGGCKHIDFIDYEVKEPENICRSEYMFFSGITNKADELRNILSGISPFINTQPLNNNYFETLIKTFHKDENYKTKFVNEINKYDLIFDCTTDNDLMYVLNSLDLSADFINMSITNHAKELVCAFHPNVYQFVNNQFSNVLENDVEDLYNPIGCWSPTFKASYNDINVLVQLALKHINTLFEEDKPKNNFVIKSTEIGLSKLNIVEF